MAAQRTLLPDGRWHFQHGPMDIVIGASGSAEALELAHTDAWLRFRGILDELVQELALLRLPVRGECPVRGPVARRMWHACQPYKSSFITPMAAVAGAVAQELVSCYAADGITRAWINNGGDIALHLTPSQSVRIGLYADLSRLNMGEILEGVQTDGQFEVASGLPVRGVATSGWRGRSFSLGIADSVTVLARTASEADAAATVIANAVDLRDTRIRRRPAWELKDDCDLGGIPVTVDVPPLEPVLVQQALRAGLKRAQALRAAGLIWSAALVCQNQVVTTGAADALAVENLSADGRGIQVGSVFA
ncbi:UPF0280 family protein [Polaromonas sp. AER18D-145]|uniref:UPF0280 family protein n=1 Tax=Polaromonas sp. AER18D-145 TaxID=1977060 RepID=UPI000BBC2604|nr:UPF0280 family protein [Polaromonas sp. AER18D-145]